MRKVLFILAIVGLALAVRATSASAHAVPVPCDFITSGGFVILDSGAHGSFGAHGGCKHGGFWGHVNYVDHTTSPGMHVNSTEITGYLTESISGTPDPNTRDICGFARLNQGEEIVRFRVRLTDNGEPGTSDMFGIRLSNGYHVSTRLLNNGEGGGGNVQLHKPNPSTTGPTPAPSEAEMCGGLTPP